MGRRLKDCAQRADGTLVHRVSRFRLAIGIASLAVGMLPTLAHAGGPAESLRPTASVRSHPTTESSQVLPAWTPSATLLTTYGHAFASRNPSELAITHRTTSHVLVGFGIAGWTELDVDLPFVLHQQGATLDETGSTNLRSSALGDVRTGLRATLLRTPRRGFGLGLGFEVTAPTGDVDALTGWGEPSYAPRLLFEHAGAHGIVSGIDVAYQVRPDIDVGGVRFGDAIALRMATRIPLSKRVPIEGVAELDAAFSMVSGGRHPLSLRAGFRGRARSGVYVSVLGGGAPVAALGVPDVQAWLSLGWAPASRMKSEPAIRRAPEPAEAYARRYYERNEAVLAKRPTSPEDPDGDGLLARADRCPGVAEDADGRDDGDGCPELDDDADGLRDEIDQCPTATEIVNGYLDDDGCPDRREGDGGRTFAVLDPLRVLPTPTFVAGTARLDAKGKVAATQLAEILRLNPGLGSLRYTVFVVQTGDPERDEALAGKRGDAILAELVSGGVSPGRLRIATAAVPGGRNDGVLLALERGVPLANEPSQDERPTSSPAPASAASMAAQGGAGRGEQ